jgi:hypothetical protein
MKDDEENNFDDSDFIILSFDELVEMEKFEQYADNEES